MCIAILAREGESRLHKFALEDLTLFIMVKIVDFFYKHGEHEPKSIETVFCSRKTTLTNHDHTGHSVRKSYFHTFQKVFRYIAWHSILF